MRSLFAVLLITLLSLTNLSAVNGSCHLEGAFCATEGSRSPGGRFSPALLGIPWHRLPGQVCARDKCAPGTSVTATRLGMTQNQDVPPITVAEYWERVRSTRQAVQEMEAKPEAEIRAGLDDLASQWEQVTAVGFPDQSIVPVAPSHLVAELRVDPPDLERLTGLLDTLSRAHEEYPQNVFTVQDIDPLVGILARPEFHWGQQARTIQMPGWLERLFNVFADLMDRLAFGVQNASYYGRVPLIIAAVIIFAVSLYFISRGLSRSLVREAELAAEGGDPDATLTSKRAMQRAQSLSGQGDYRNAIRYLYLSSLLVLDEQGLLRYDRSRTNREVLRSVSSKPNVSRPLGDVIDVFDRVWYGFEPVDEDTYQSYSKHVDELREKKE